MMKISRTAVEGLKKWIKFVHKVMMLIVIYFCSKKPCISAAFDFYENVGDGMIEELEGDDEKVVDRMRMLEELEGGDDENVVDRVRMIEKLGKGDDRISGLPDDILISIISGLTLPEATATSILSSRWRYLHTQLDRVVLPPTSDSTPSRKNLSKYVRMISGAMDSHKSGLVLKEFRICLNRYRGKVYALRCLQFALARRAEIIDINIDSPLHILYIQRYTLRFSNLVRRSTGGHQSLAGLRELSLSGVSWGDEDGIEYLLSNAPLLERLSLSCYRRLKNFSITGNPRLKLTHLQISEARYLESIQIAHLNYLVSFKCYQLGSNALTLNNVPNLTELGASEHEHMVPLGYILGRVPCCVLDQLQTFKLWTYRRRIWEPVPRLLNIKYLEVEFSMHYDVNETRSLFSLIEACTSLEEIEIKFLQKDMAFKERRIFFSSPSTKLSPNIKKMKLSGYIGRSVESEVALFVVKNVAAFQELVIQLCDDQTPKIRRRASRCAHKYFRRITILDSVNLLIL